MLLNKQRAKAVMEKYGLAAIIAAMPENVTYLTDYWSLSHWLLKGTATYAVLPADEKVKPFIVTPVGELDQAANDKNCWVEDYRTFGTFHLEMPSGAAVTEREAAFKQLLASRRQGEDAVSALIEGLKERGLHRGRIALDEMNLAAGQDETIRNMLPEADMLAGHAIMREIRAVKSPEEVQRLERAVDIIEAAFHCALESIKEGVTELEVSRALENAVTERGGLPLLTVIGAGANSVFCNAMPSSYQLKKGDFVRFDIGCVYQGYYSDTARIAVLGRPNDKQRMYYDAVKEGEERALALVRPGARAADIFEEAVKGVREAGIPHYKRHHVGHGIGIECYDIPLLAPGSKHILEEGMVLNVETPYYELGFGGVQVEDTLVVTADGYRLLTKSDRDLFVL
jgi:Xaa-Pro dipeptidase